MSSPKTYAFFEIKCAVDRLSDFSNKSSLWVEGHSNITPFDFDNHSEPYIADLGLRLVDETDGFFLLINETVGIKTLGSISRFLNRITRKYADKATICYLTEDPRLAPFYKVMRAHLCADHRACKELLDDWIKAVEIDQPPPGKGSDL